MFGFGLQTAVNFELSETNSRDLTKWNLVGSFQLFHVFLCVFSTGTATRSPYLLPVSQRVRTCIHLHFVYRGNLRAQVARSILASFLKRRLSVACVLRGMRLMGKGNGLLSSSKQHLRWASKTNFTTIKFDYVCDNKVSVCYLFKSTTAEQLQHHRI